MKRLLLGAVFAALIFPVAVAAAGGREGTEESPAVVAVDFADEVDQRGILVSRVINDSPAQAAGILRGDIVLAVDSVDVNTIAELQTLLADYEAGDGIEVRISRGREELTVQLELETRLYRPAIGIEAATGPAPGFRAMPGDRPFMHRFFGDGYPEFMGVHGDIVTAVEEDSPADRAGILEGDAIVRIGDVTLDDLTVADAIADLSPDDTVEIEVARRDEDGDRETVVLTATLGSNDDGGAYLGIGYFPMGMRQWNMEDMMERFDGFPGDAGRLDPRHHMNW